MGYRIGEAYVGRGVASVAVALALDEARARGHWAVEARVASGNPASIRVLEKTGFYRTGAAQVGELDMALYSCDLD